MSVYAHARNSSVPPSQSRLLKTKLYPADGYLHAVVADASSRGPGNGRELLYRSFDIVDRTRHRTPVPVCLLSNHVSYFPFAAVSKSNFCPAFTSANVISDPSLLSRSPKQTASRNRSAAGS